jgi:hypothetical protein
MIPPHKQEAVDQLIQAYRDSAYFLAIYPNKNADYFGRPEDLPYLKYDGNGSFKAAIPIRDAPRWEGLFREAHGDTLSSLSDTIMFGREYECYWNLGEYEAHITDNSSKKVFLLGAYTDFESNRRWIIRKSRCWADTDKYLVRIISAGLSGAESKLDDPDLRKLITHPGFLL